LFFLRGWTEQQSSYRHWFRSGGQSSRHHG